MAGRTYLLFFILTLLGAGCRGQSSDLGTADRIETLIHGNALELSRLNNLFQNLLEFAVENPCVENEFVNAVATAIGNGFFHVQRDLKAVLHSLNYLALLKWRIDFAKSLGFPLHTGDTPCPLPFFMSNGECIYMELKLKTTFRMAKLSCQLMGGFLAKPDNFEKFALTIKQMHHARQQEVYIGAVTYANGNWSWQNSGEGINRTVPWYTSGSTASEGQNCIVLKAEEYKPIPCLKKRHFVCEIPL